MTWQLIDTLELRSNQIVFSQPFQEVLIRLSSTFIRENEATSVLFHHVLSQSPLTFVSSRRIILRQNVKQVIKLSPMGDETLESNKSIGIVARENGWIVEVEKFIG